MKPAPIEGLKPVVAIYSSFLQRAYDQLIHDVALQNLPVLFAIDRARDRQGRWPGSSGGIRYQLPAYHPQPDHHDTIG